MSGRRWTLLRSAHKGEEATPRPDRILTVWEDMWCALFATAVKMDEGIGLIWKKGEPMIVREGRFPSVVGIRHPRPTEVANFGPDILWDRGGYAAYRPAIKAAIDAKPEGVRIYYGAGERFSPPSPPSTPDAFHYDIILVDTHLQRRRVEREHPLSLVAVFPKPAAPVFEATEPHCDPVQMNFDVVFICTRPEEFKGPKWLAERLPKGARVIRIGRPDPWFEKAEEQGRFEMCWTGHIPREQIPDIARRAKFGVVCDDGKHDSGPRILPELLAMNLPVIVRHTVRADLAEYIVPHTGIIVGEEPRSFTEAYDDLQDTWRMRTPRAWYDEHLSLKKAAERLLQLVDLAEGKR